MCRLYPGAQILAVNVTDSSATYDSKLPCPVKVIEIPRSAHKAADILTKKKVRRKVISHGYNQTLGALGQ